MYKNGENGSNQHEKRKNRGENFGKFWEKSPKN